MRTKNQRHLRDDILSVHITSNCIYAVKIEREMIEMDNQIKITHIESPHKFWYKKCDDLIGNERLKELEDNIKIYATDIREWKEHLPINRGDEVVALHSGWNKWIRGKAGRLQSGSQTNIFVWAIDYGCSLLLPLADVYLLEDQMLAYINPINVHIGGLSGILPAKIVS